MADPMTPERLAEIRERTRRLTEPVGLIEADRLALLAEVERLTAELADLAAQNAKTEDNFRDFAEDALAVQRERDEARVEAGRLRAELAKPKGDEVLDWVAECDKPGHPDWYLHSENWPSDMHDCPTCAVERAEAERDEAREQVKRVRELLSQWERPDNLQVDLRDLRAALDGPEAAPDPTDPA